MAEHPWWKTFGKPTDVNDLTPGPEMDLAQAIQRRNSSAVRIREVRLDEAAGHTALLVDIDVQRPQRLEHAINQTEPLAIVFSREDIRPAVFSARDDFPDTPHQNWVPEGCPSSLCVDDRPWPEAKLSYTPAEFLWRIETWLSKAARGELHDPSQPLDPIFLQSSETLILPAEALANADKPLEFCGQYKVDNPSHIIARPYTDAPPDTPGFVVLSYQLPPQAMPRMRYAPTTLGKLNDELNKAGIDLFDDMRKRLRGWAGMDSENRRRLAERLVIVVQFPVMNAGRTANDVRAFLTSETAGQVGEALGILLKNVTGSGYSQMLMQGQSRAEGIKVLHTQVHLHFNRDMAAAISGHAQADRRRVILIGAGSLGSQLGMSLIREGKFCWTVIDGDTLLPHNLGRHALLHNSLAASKAGALASEMGALIGERVDAYRWDVLQTPREEERKEYDAKFTEADFIIDASASVAVSRHLSDMSNSPARRFSVFFNPAGTAAVLLAEGKDRSITLRDLEAQYHRLLLTEPTLEDHLVQDVEGVRYSGSCRALTNRIASTNATILSALIARGIAACADQDEAEIRIWSCLDDGGVSAISRRGERVFHIDTNDWKVTYDRGLLKVLSDRRDLKLPNETGGILLGVVDMNHRSIHIAQALPEPVDSKGSPTEFERGISGLAEILAQASKTTMDQLRYVGEWHSHPKYSSADPSGKDIVQLVWLGKELIQDGVPGLMMIAGHQGDFRLAIAVAVNADAVPEADNDNGR